VTALAAAAGVAFVAGILLVASGVHPAPKARRRPRPAWHFEPAQMVGAVVAGGAALLVTRWPVAGVAAAVTGWFLALPLLRRRRISDAERAEAIALWAEMLRDAMGTARGMEGVLVATAATAPAAIRPEVQRMARRLTYDPLDDVLDGLGEDLAHPIGDLVVTALRLASKAGARQTRDVLDGLAAAAYRDAEMHQRVEVARQRPRTAMRWVTVIIAGFIVLLILFARDYLEPYGTAAGQVVLVFVLGYWGLGLWWMARMGRITQTPRFMARRPPT
jgi:Flp pilus assembly protein TadB